jgi:zinc/manganese transport system substrate-binding protein
MKTMMKGALAALAIFVLAGSPAWAKMKVCASLPDLASVAQSVGGDLVEVVSLTDGNQDPHFVPAKPSLMRSIRNADVYVAVGLELEVGWLPVVLQGSRNPKIQPGAPGFVDASQGVEVLEKPTGTVNRAEGDVHPMGNPHYYTDPENLKVVADQLSDKFSELDPAHADAYRANAKAFDQRMAKALVGWEKKLAPFKGSPVVCYHNNFLYFTHRFGLKDFGFLENRPGIPPSARHLSELSAKMKAAGVKVVLYQPYYDGEACKHLAESAGATALLAPSEAGGVVGVTDVFSHFNYLVDGLAKALAN